MEDIFRGVGVEITLSQRDDFLKVAETLTRIGIPSYKDRKLFQSCHILHKQGRYSILHFKELFMLDGKQASLDPEDIARRNRIVALLAEWGLLEQVTPFKDATDELAPMTAIKIIPFRERDKWNLVAKYTIGKRKAKL